MVRRVGRAIAAAALLGGTAEAAAQAPDGAALARACTACHGAASEARGAIPPLAGRDAHELEGLMTAFAEGRLEGTMMPRLLRDYTPAEIAALAAHLSAEGS